MSNFALHDCQIDCAFSWRPEFSKVAPRLRVAFFDERLVATSFIDASESVTDSVTAFEGSPLTPWRDVVQQVLDGEETVTFNVEWPGDMTLAGPEDLNFDRPPSPTIKVLSLAWLGSQWSDVARALLTLSDDKLSELDQRHDLLALAADVCGEVERMWGGYEGYLSADEIVDQMISGALRGERPSQIAEQLLEDANNEDEEHPPPAPSKEAKPAER